MWPWLFSPIGKRVLFAAAFLALLAAGFFALRAHYISIGRQAAAASALEEGKKTLAGQQKEFQRQYRALDSERQADAARSRALLATAEKLAASIAQIETARTRASAAVAALPATSLVPDLRRKLNVAPVETAPQLTSPELRAADRIVTDYPAVAAEKRDAEARANALASRADALQAELKDTGAQSDLALGWGDDVFAQYRACYNSFPRQRGILTRLCHVFSFGLACRPKKLSLAPPGSLSRARPSQPAAPPAKQ